MGLEAFRLVAGYLAFQAQVPAFSGNVARRIVELLQVLPSKNTELCSCNVSFSLQGVLQLQGPFHDPGLCW